MPDRRADANGKGSLLAAAVNPGASGCLKKAGQECPAYDIRLFSGADTPVPP